MIASDVQHKIKSLEIKTRKMLSGMMVGDHTMRARGSGFEFDQIRPYEQGDDVRFIDWKSSAKVNKLLVKQYLEDKNRDITICVDISSSTQYASGCGNKEQAIREIAAVIALISQLTKDRVSLILFSDKIDHHVPKGLGNMHTQRLLEHIFNYCVQEYAATDINILIEFLIKNNKKEGVIFIVSDFIVQQDFSKNIQLLNRKSEVIAICCRDFLEIEFPARGIIHFNDIETNEIIALDTKKFKGALLKNIAQLLRKNRIDVLELVSHEDYFSLLINFFRRRMMY